MADALKPFPDDWTSALGVAAHPDDLEYGTASAVAAWTGAGKSVAYVLLTSGEAGIDDLDPAECGPLREAEERAGAGEVGVSRVEFLGYPDGVLEYGLGMRRDLTKDPPGSIGRRCRARPGPAARLGRHRLRRSPGGRFGGRGRGPRCRVGASAPDPDAMLRGFARLRGERFGGVLAVNYVLLG